MKSHIFIIGMMGSGKSTLAPLLSQKLKIPFTDTDKDLENIFNLDIKKIFDQFSEKKFRELESTYFLEHIKKSRMIYATGGGIVMIKKNRHILRSKGSTIYLNASIETLNNRLVNHQKKRPLFTNKNSLKTILNERKQYYKDCADIIINIDEKSSKNILNEIIEKLNK